MGEFCNYDAIASDKRYVVSSSALPYQIPTIVQPFLSSKLPIQSSFNCTSPAFFWKEPSSKRTVSRKKIRSILTCDAVDRAEGENALAAFTASANTRTDLENIIVYLFIIFRDPDVVLLYSFNISERRCKMCLIDVCFLKVAFACFSDGYRSLP